MISRATCITVGHPSVRFAAVALVGGLMTLLFAIETKGRVIEELSP